MTFHISEKTLTIKSDGLVNEYLFKYINDGYQHDSSTKIFLDGAITFMLIITNS